MKTNKTAATTASAPQVKYECKVTRAHAFNEQRVAFDLEVNGVMIYGMVYLEGKSEKTGNEYKMISFPQEKGKDGNYYNKAFFPVSAELKDDIIAQLEKLV